jgi:hypothetical protein
MVIQALSPAIVPATGLNFNHETQIAYMQCNNGVKRSELRPITRQRIEITNDINRLRPPLREPKGLARPLL